MKRIISTLVITTIGMMCALPVIAQPQRASPHETIKAEIDGANISITYGRPYTVKPGTTEVRKIWGGLVPWGKAWRLGADQSTTLITDQPILIGETNLPAGTYRLYLVPMETGLSKLAINKKTGIWGIQRDQTVDETEDLIRVDAKKEPMDKQLDQLAMAIEKNPAGGGTIKIMWEKTQFSVPFTVKK